MYAATRIRTDWAAIALGLALAALLVAGWRVGGATEAPAAEVELTTASSSDFAVLPEGVTTEQGRVSPSTPEGGFDREVVVRNATGDLLGLRVRADSGGSELDRVLQVRVQLQNQVVYEGPAAGLTSGSTPFELGSHQSVPLSILAWLPESTPGQDWQARSTSLRFELVSSKGN